MLRWYVVYANPHKEALASANLRAQGFETYLPLLRKTVRHARRTQVKLAPLFPRYLFVALDVSVHRWRSVRGTIGVSWLIMDDETPRPVPEGVVEALLEAHDGQGGYNFKYKLQIGQRVQFLNGPFANSFGTLTELDNKGRVKVLYELLGAEREIVVDGDNLLPTAA